MSDVLSLAIQKMTTLVSNWKSEYLYLQVSPKLAEEINTILDSYKGTNQWLMVGVRPLTSCFLSKDGKWLIKLGKPEVYFE